MDYYSFCEDESVRIKVEGMPIHRFFAPEEFLRFGLEPIAGNEDHYMQIVDMPIDEFLGLAEPIPDDDLKRHAPMEDFKRDVASGKTTSWDIPYLTIKENEDGIWKVVGHDGRHRGMLLRSLGYNNMPVRLDIDETMNEELLPELLWCQNDKSVEREKDFYPFPITEANFMQPYVTVGSGVVVLGSGENQSVVAVDEMVQPKRKSTKGELLRYLSGEDERETEDAKFRGKAPWPCRRAKKNFLKDYVSDLLYRKDNVMPARNLKEYLSKKSPRGVNV